MDQRNKSVRKRDGNSGGDKPSLPRLQDNVLAGAKVCAGVARVRVGRRLQFRVQHLQLYLQSGCSRGCSHTRGARRGCLLRVSVYCGGMISHSHSL